MAHRIVGGLYHVLGHTRKVVPAFHGDPAAIGTEAPSLFAAGDQPFVLPPDRQATISAEPGSVRRGLTWHLPVVGTYLVTVRRVTIVFVHGSGRLSGK